MQREGRYEASARDEKTHCARSARSWRTLLGSSCSIPDLCCTTGRLLSGDDVDEEVELVRLAEGLGYVGPGECATLVRVCNDVCAGRDLRNEDFGYSTKMGFKHTSMQPSMQRTFTSLAEENWS